MPVDSPEAEAQITFMHTLDARKRVVEALNKSQEREHAFYKEAATAAGRHMQALCSAWIRVLIDQVRDSESDVEERFLKHAGVPRELLVSWRKTYCDHERLKREIGSASLALTESEHAKSRFSGAIWGAKKGQEQQYHAAAEATKIAGAHVSKLRAQFMEAEKALDDSSDALLRECVSKSAVISASPDFGATIAQVLREIQADARSMERAHTQEQSALIETMDRALGFLKTSYGQR